MWNGSYRFGPGYFLYLGPSGDNEFHAHAPLQITFGLGAALKIETQDGVFETKEPIVIASGVGHRLCPAEKALIVLVEPDCRLAVFLLRALNGRKIIASSEFIDPTKLTFEDPQALEAQLFGSQFAKPRSLDPRLRQALSFLRSASLKGAVSACAADIGVSQSRLRHLALAELGIPLSKWMIWAAVERSAGALRKGAGLAEAAAAGGFADQAHYTRTLKRLMGIRPSVARALLGNAQANGSIFKQREILSSPLSRRSVG